MSKNGYPVSQGLYDPEQEHEACGIGMIANINGKQTHSIVQHAVTILCNMEHRGGQSSDTSTGDGAGILTQIPHRFFQKQCEKENIYLPSAGDYGVGMVFLPKDHDTRMKSKEVFERIIAEEGQIFLGWRPVPINDSFVGKVASKTKPTIRQVFIKVSEDIKNQLDFERKLYIIRKRIEKEIASMEGYEDVYISSLSTRTIVYKGMLIPEQLDSFYIDLNHPDYKSALALVHSRFSTNTFPSWKRAHPNRYTIHNGEFNTLRGNVNWMRAREQMCESEFFNSEDLQKVLPVIDSDGSDSSMFDNCFEFLHLSGRSLAHTAMMMVPEPWANDKNIKEEKRDFYEYHSTLMEPWDGPAALVFTDGNQIAACLDRNGLRPSRYSVTKDGYVIMSSEIGVVDIDPQNVEYHGRLEPGRMFLVNMNEGRIVNDEEIKTAIATKKPYGKWVNANLVHLKDIPYNDCTLFFDELPLEQRQILFGYTQEDVNSIIMPMAQNAKEPIGSMGHDTPLAVLSERPQLIYNYFKQLFAQVTNPPLDGIREHLITDISLTLGSDANLFDINAEHCKKLKIQNPVISKQDLDKIKSYDNPHFNVVSLPMLYPMAQRHNGLEQALENLLQKASGYIDQGTNILILSDRHATESMAPIPALLACSYVNSGLQRLGKRSKLSIIIESAEPREVHHFALLFGYGASA
ncbi:MAG: glutamate synthase central domain-containing protein, partial [Paenisporosarcina sp.]|nr:glutamate synthase central domain-containing protein [Paenisporosarcina sp.]